MISRETQFYYVEIVLQWIKSIHIGIFSIDVKFAFFMHTAQSWDLWKRGQKKDIADKKIQSMFEIYQNTK